VLLLFRLETANLKMDTQPTVETNNRYNDILVRFDGYLRQQRYSRRTIANYIERLRVFFQFCQKDVLEIDNDDVDNFNQNYIIENKLSASYQTQFISALKLFYKKIARKKLVMERLERPRQGKHLPETLAREDVARIINATNNLKHKTMISFIYACGLRRDELLNMKISAIDSKQNIIRIRRGKGDKDRALPLSPKMLELLREYYKAYRPVTWLFEGQTPGTHYTSASLQKVFTHAMKKAGIQGDYSLHTLRHCFATHLLQDGVNIRVIQDLLGHKNMKTTLIYLHLTPDDMKTYKSPFDGLDV
jgi:integrase/recombinase XerD